MFFVFVFILSILIKGEVVTSGAQQTAESELQVPSTAETTDPLFYPSWYKSKSRQASSPSLTQMSDGLGQVGPSISLEMNVKKAETTEAATSNESAPGSGKETSTTAATSQVSVNDISVYLHATRGPTGI